MTVAWTVPSPHRHTCKLFTMKISGSVFFTFTFFLQQILTKTVASQSQFTAPASFYPTEPLHNTTKNGMDQNLKRSKFLIRKCCDQGQIYNFNWEENVVDRRDRCVKYSIRDHLSTSSIGNSKQIFLGHEQYLPSSENVIENFEIHTGFPPNCSNDDMLLQPDMKMADHFYRLTSGQLLVPHRFWLIQFKDHCIEDYFENNNFTKPRRVAFICGSQITEFPATAINNRGKLQFNFIGSKIPAELSSSAGRSVIRKCCDRNEVYAQNLQCMENQGFATLFFDSLQSTRTDEIFFRIGLPSNCYLKPTHKFHLLSNGSLEISGGINSRSDSGVQLVSIEHYCIEDMIFFESTGLPKTSNVAFFCSDQHNLDQQVPELTIPENPIDSDYEINYNDSIKINTPKCCPSGYVMVMDERDTCQPLKLGEDSSDVDWSISQALNNYFLSKHKIVSNIIPNNFSGSCELISFAPIAETSAEVKFEGDAKNELSLSFHYNVKNYWDFKIKPKPFCVDLVLFRSEKEVSYLPQIYYCTAQFHVSIHYPILLCISVAGLIATFIIYFFVPTSGSAKLVTSGFGAGSRRTRTPTMATLLTGRILLCHIFTLSLTFISMAIVQRENFEPTENSCVAIGYIMYAESIASFAWLSVYCFDYYRIFSGSFKVSNEKLFIPYSLFGWGVPILAVIAAAIAQFRSTDLGISGTINPNIGILNCWFPDGSTSAMIFFYVPVGTLLLLDIICFLSLVFNPNLMYCWKRKQGLTIRKNQKDSKEQQDFKMALKLFFITGIPWMFEVAAWLPVYLSGKPASFQNNSVGQYVLEIGNLLNSLRGVMIFMIFIVLQKNVRHFLMLRFRKILNKDFSDNIALQNSRTNTDGTPTVSTQQTTSGGTECVNQAG